MGQISLDFVIPMETAANDYGFDLVVYTWVLLSSQQAEAQVRVAL